jgi:hypothetical protein
MTNQNKTKQGNRSDLSNKVNVRQIKQKEVVWQVRAEARRMRVAVKSMTAIHVKAKAT